MDDVRAVMNGRVKRAARSASPKAVDVQPLRRDVSSALRRW
jgi:hypothetical protein